ncbi:(2S)-3-sulfopropanediol dehydratase activating enzyme [Clostridium pasteurianum]|uniref:Glycyl-radical enzyme activator family protein n=1 Tax=Clostridium pasteurianum BC1 TaxID=86416 RepID=R4K8J2_CLOPA|nr:glycyl-radical enzyme activating protein [Clostridium pasteurianum]AGK95960.1 glycyl-radical enzyme activator family protein [Clostridium pasteurianum BC1]
MIESKQCDKSKQGYVFNIQSYSVHDGPGIRTIVFLKGCPLKCRWCSNPESQKSELELAYNSCKCILSSGCTECLSLCSNDEIRKTECNEIIIDRNIDIDPNIFADACPSKALSVYGKLMTVEEVLKLVEKDSVFYARSGGGLTISGGEPLSQPEFTIELLKAAKKRRMNTAIETCGYTNWSNLEQVAEFLDTILFDIKSVNKDKHLEFTKASNELILDNFIKLCEKFPKLNKLVRTPVIPGFNDSEEDIEEIVNFLKGKPNVSYELLAYHRLGEPKYEYIDRQYPMDEVKLDMEKMKKLKVIAETINSIK